jgi:uncharacterized protein YdeI (YjbR/CyaY-like superfamily)
MKLTTTFYAKNRTEWRKWLYKNGGAESEVWLIFYKKHTGEPCIDYEEAVEEALCAGWIDSIIQKLDENRYVRKFTPRKPNSKWSATNLKRVKKLVAEGRMKENPKSNIQNPKRENPKEKAISEDVIQAVKANKAAKNYFETLPPGYMKTCMRWIDDAKRPETRVRRIAEFVELCSRSERIGMK